MKLEITLHKPPRMVPEADADVAQISKARFGFARSAYLFGQ